MRSDRNGLRGPLLWLAAGIVAIALLGFVASHLHVLLAPARPVGRGVLVVEGWVGIDTLTLAAQRYRQGDYHKLVVTGGRLPDTWRHFVDFETYAERGVYLLVESGLPPEELAAVSGMDAPTSRTYSNALAVGKWLERAEITSGTLDVVTEGLHGLRSWVLYRRALSPDFEVGIVSAAPADYEPRAWWRSSAGAKAALGESLGLLYAFCCLDP